jgi:hypothetical protein
MTSGPDHAFLWSGGTMTDLNAFAAPGWVLQSAQSISDTGYITGFGQFDPNGGDASDSVTRAFVLAPNAIGASVPEPGVIALGVGAASFGLALFRRRK